MNNKILNSQISNLKSTGGFSLIELIVVIAIMIGTGAAVFAGLNSFRTKAKLTDSTQKLVDDLKIAQSNANTGVGCNSDNLPSKEWGIRFIQKGSAQNEAKYVIESKCSDGYVNQVREETLPKKIVVYEIVIKTGDAGCTSAFSNANNPAVYFKTIASDIRFSTNCPQASNSKMIVNLKSLSTNTIQTIIIDQGGSIFIKSP